MMINSTHLACFLLVFSSYALLEGADSASKNTTEQQRRRPAQKIAPIRPTTPFLLKTSINSRYGNVTGGEISDSAEVRGLAVTVQPEKKKFQLVSQGLSFKVTLKNESKAPFYLYGGLQLSGQAQLVVGNQRTASQWNLTSKETIPKNKSSIRLGAGKEIITFLYTSVIQPAFINPRPVPFPNPVPRPRPKRPFPVPELDKQTQLQIKPGHYFEYCSLALNGVPLAIDRGSSKEQVQLFSPSSDGYVLQRESQIKKPGIVPVPPQAIYRSLPCGKGTCRAMVLLKFIKPTAGQKQNLPYWTGRIASRPVEFEVVAEDVNIRNNPAGNRIRN